MFYQIILYLRSFFESTAFIAFLVVVRSGRWKTELVNPEPFVWRQSYQPIRNTEAAESLEEQPRSDESRSAFSYYSRPNQQVSPFELPRPTIRGTSRKARSYPLPYFHVFIFYIVVLKPFLDIVGLHVALKEIRLFFTDSNGVITLTSPGRPLYPLLPYLEMAGVLSPLFCCFLVAYLLLRQFRSPLLFVFGEIILISCVSIPLMVIFDQWRKWLRADFFEDKRFVDSDLAKAKDAFAGGIKALTLSLAFRILFVLHALCGSGHCRRFWS